MGDIKSESRWVRYESSLRWPLIITKRSDLNIVFTKLVNVFRVEFTCKNMSFNHKFQLVCFLDKFFTIWGVTNYFHQFCQIGMSLGKLAPSERWVYTSNCFLLWFHYHLNALFVVMRNFWVVEASYIINTTLSKTFFFKPIATKWVSSHLKFMDAWRTSRLDDLPQISVWHGWTEFNFGIGTNIDQVIKFLRPLQALICLFTAHELIRASFDV